MGFIKIDNFRLPVSHIAEPFKAKIRYTPAAANKPSRMEKDLEQAKKLVVVLEAQAAEVAAYKPVYPVGAPPSAEAPQPETAMEDVKTEEIDPTRGSKAVEERVDKLASETLDTDENGNPDKAKWVRMHFSPRSKPCIDDGIQDGLGVRHVPVLPSRSIQLLLLLRLGH